MLVRLEHANICVKDIDLMIGVLETAFPDFRVRGKGLSQDRTIKWLHIGTDVNYIALQLSEKNAV